MNVYYKSRMSTFVIGVICFIFISICGHANSIYIMIIPRNVSLMDLYECKNKDFQELLNQKSAMALASNRTGGKSNFQNAATTISAGEKSAISIPKIWSESLATDISMSAMSTITESISDERVSEYYERITGYKVGNNTAFVNAGISRSKNIQKSLHYGAKIGMLGELLSKNNVEILFYGKSDLNDHPFRPASIIAMDYKGQISGKENADTISKSVISDFRYPYGVRTDYNYIISHISKKIKNSKNLFAVVECGDFYRMDKESALYSQDKNNEIKNMIFSDFFDFNVKLNNLLLTKDINYNVSIMPLEIGEQPNSLLPVVMLRNDIKSFSVLTSDTTKRDGFISTCDITADILNYFNIVNSSTGFVPIVSKNTKIGTINDLLKENSRIINTYKTRPNVIIGFVAMSGIVALSLAFVLIFYRQLFDLNKLISFVQNLTMFLMLVPLAILISPILKIAYIYSQIVFIMLFSTLLLFLLKKIWKNSIKQIILSICFLIFTIVSGDIVFGEFFAQRSLLSYDPMVGARFYGLGNEYCGILIACAMLFSYILWDMKSNLKCFSFFIFIVSIFTIFLIGAPFLGTNFGGMLAAVCGMGFAFLYALNFKYDTKFFIVLALGILLIAGGIVFFNMIYGAETHIGRAFSGLMNGDVSGITNTVIRKLEMNLTLMKVSRWIFALISCLIFLIIILFNPMGVTKKLFSGHRILRAGFCGLIVAMVVGFAVNDSGIVMMATGIMYITFSLALLSIEELKNEKYLSVYIKEKQ